MLISKQTFSAAESFAFGLKAVGRARLVGETTGGGGHMNDFFPLPEGLGVSISVGRTFDPRTGEGWQATGIVPGMVTEADHALSEALFRITRESGRLAALSPEERAIYHHLQRYTRAWYDADREGMAREIADEFHSTVRNLEGVVERDRTQHLAATGDGAGRQPRLYHNRIIRDIEIDDGVATADLVLRASIHRIRFHKTDGDWRIARDDSEAKYLSR